MGNINLNNSERFAILHDEVVPGTTAGYMPLSGTLEAQALQESSLGSFREALKCTLVQHLAQSLISKREPFTSCSVTQTLYQELPHPLFILTLERDLLMFNKYSSLDLLHHAPLFEIKDRGLADYSLDPWPMAHHGP